MTEQTLAHVAFTEEDIRIHGWARLKDEALIKLRNEFDLQMREGRRTGTVYRFKLIIERHPPGHAQ